MEYVIKLKEEEFSLLCDMVWDAEQLYFRKIEKVSNMSIAEYENQPKHRFKLDVWKQTAARRLRDKITEQADVLPNEGFTIEVLEDVE